MVRIGDIRPRLWHEIVDDLAQGGIDIPHVPMEETHFAAHSNECNNIHAPESTLSESQYYNAYYELASGVGQRLLREFDVLWRWVLPNYDIFQHEPMLPWAVLVILFFVLRKRLRLSKLVFVFAFLLNVTPLYAYLLFALAYFCSQPHAPKGYTQPKQISKLDIVSTPFEDAVYDYILLGGSVSSYFCASILAVVGKKVLVLIPQHSAIYAVRHYPKTRAAFDVVNLTTGLPDRYQRLLDTVYVGAHRLLLHTVARAAKVNTILHIDDPEGPEGNPQVYVVGSGENAFAQALHRHFSASTAAINTFLEYMQKQYECVAPYLLNKIHVNAEDRVDSFCRQSCEAVLSDVTTRVKDIFVASPLLRHLPSLHCRQSIAPQNASAVSLCAAVLGQQSGGYYIAGGMLQLERASLGTIQRAGGRMVIDVNVKQLAIGDKNECQGVVMSDGTVIRAKYGVISGLGAICTFTRMLPSQDDVACRSLLKNIEEQRPKIKVCISTSGVRALGSDTMLVSRRDLDEEKVIHGNTLWMWSPSGKQGRSTSKSQHLIIVEMEAGDALVTLVDEPCRHFEANSSLAATILEGSAGIEIVLPEELRCRVKRVAEAAMLRVYPSVKVFKSAVLNVYVGGHALSSNTAKYSSNITAETPVKSLFLCGEDIATSGFAGELQGGWMAANAALGYTRRDIQRRRNVIHDIRQYLHGTTMTIFKQFMQAVTPSAESKKK